MTGTAHSSSALLLCSGRPAGQLPLLVASSLGTHEALNRCTCTMSTPVSLSPEVAVTRLIATQDAIIRASGQSLLMVDRSGQVSSASEGVPQLFGYEHGHSLIGLNVDVLMHEVGSSDFYLDNFNQRVVQGVQMDGGKIDFEVGLSGVEGTNTVVIMLKKVKRRSSSFETRRRYSKILDAAFDPMVCTSQEGIIFEVNQAAVDQFGWTRDELIGQNVSLIVGGCHRERHDSYVEQSGTTGEKLMIGKQREIQARGKDGTEFVAELGLSEIDDEDGEKFFCGFIRNLTKQKTYERRISEQTRVDVRKTRELKDYQSTILGILDASFHALFVMNDKCVIQMVNHKSCELFGWTKEEFVGRNIAMIMTKDVASNHDQYVQNYLQTGIRKMIGTQREVNGQKKDGTTFPCVLGLAETKDSCLICGFIRDLTSEKAAEADVIEKQKLTSRIIDASFDALFVINQRGIIQMTNNKSAEVFGWTQDEFLDQNISMIMPKGHSNNHDRYLATYMATRTKRLMGTERELEARCKDGSSFPCILGLTELQSDNAEDNLYCGFIRSIAQTKQFERRISDQERESSQAILQQQSTILGILDASFHALFVMNNECIIQMVNSKSVEVFGWTREEFVGQNISMIMTKDVAVHHDQYVKNYLQTGVKVRHRPSCIPI